MLRALLEARLAHLLGSAPPGDEAYRLPAGAPALIAADSVSWRVFKNPVTVFIGGLAAVVLELAEPRVGTGVWQFTSFRERPLERLQRTGAAAMLTVYGARSRAEAMIDAVRRRHDAIRGVAPDGRAFCANDPELLEWVHATAAFGFLQAYHACARPLSAAEHDRFYAEARPVALRYGATSAPASTADVEALFASMDPTLRGSPMLVEFLHIALRLPALPRPLRPLQAMLVRSAVDLVPLPLRERLGLHGRSWRLPEWQRDLVRQAAGVADRMVLRTHPAVLACRRLGLPDGHLYPSG